MFQPLVGYFLDGVGLRLGFALCAILWSLITMAGAFVGMACQDMSGRAIPADFAFFRYEGRVTISVAGSGRRSR